MKKILSIVVLSVVLLSVVIVPSFAVSLDEIEQQYGLQGYYTLNLSDPLVFEGVSASTYSSNRFVSYFSSEDVVIYVSGQLRITSSDLVFCLTYDVMFDAYSSSDVGHSIIGGSHFAEFTLYVSSYVEYGNGYVGPDVIDNLELLYDIFITEYPYLAGSLSFDDFVFVFTNFADATQSPIVDSDDTAFQQFLNDNTTFTATNSIMELPTPPPPPPIVIEETGNVFTSVLSWAGTFVNTVFNNTGLLILFLLGVGISIVLVVIRILRKVMWSN